MKKKIYNKKGGDSKKAGKGARVFRDRETSLGAGMIFRKMIANSSLFQSFSYPEKRFHAAAFDFRPRSTRLPDFNMP